MKSNKVNNFFPTDCDGEETTNGKEKHYQYSQNNNNT